MKITGILLSPAPLFNSHQFGDLGGFQLSAGPVSIIVEVAVFGEQNVTNSSSENYACIL